MAPKIVTDAQKILDVFQPGLKRGAERLWQNSSKRYFYVEHPTEGWRVYLRAVCFIHELHKPFCPSKFIVVKRTGGDAGKATWEPPKGQMEGRDGLRNPTASIYQLLRENVKREVEEESKIRTLRELQHTGLVLQSTESDYPANTYFQYHIFSAYAHPSQIRDAQESFTWFEEHPAAFARLRRDNREKDGITFFDPATTKLMGKWSPALVAMYINALSPS